MPLSVPAVVRFRRAAVALALLFLFGTAPSGAASGGETAARVRAADLLMPAPAGALDPTFAAAPRITTWLLRADALAALRRESAVILEDFPLPDGGTADLDVRRFTIFPADAQIIAMTETGPVRRPIPDVTLYRGRVRGHLSSWVYLAVERDGISGTIIAGPVQTTLYTGMVASAAPGGAHVLHVTETTPEMKHYDCGVTEHDIARDFRGMPDGRSRTAAAGDTLSAAIAIDADQAAFQHYGSVANTENYITARMGESSAIYERDVSITLTVPFLRVWTTPDPFPGTSDRQLLNVFTAYWRDSMTTVDRTLALLITRKPISAPGVSQGLAWLDRLCSSANGYNITKFSANNGFIDGHVGVLAHEIGHNFGSPHTHSCTWNPPVDSCYTAEPIGNNPPCFGASDRHLILGGGEMMSYCHMSYGNQNKFNIFRDRVGGLVRARAEAAPCMSVTSTVRSLTLTAPRETFSVCAGQQIDLTWEAQGINDVSILLSRNNGATYDTVLARSIERNARSWTWRVPGNFPPGTGYRLRIVDNKNPSLEDEMTVSFTVLEGVYIVTQNMWRNVCVGQGARFEVVARGPGTLRYEWKKNGTVIPGAVTDTIWVQNTVENDNGSLVTCTITSDCGTVTSEPALLKVFSRPIITQQPKSDTVCIGGRAVFRIAAEGPELTYKWLTLGKVFEVNSPEFVIDNVKDSDRGGYYCEVTSPCGKVNTMTGILVIPTPSVSALMSPAPYQELKPGQQFDLLWKTFCLPAVKLEYSTDGGTTWTTMEGSYPADSGRYTWTVPDIVTNNGQFRVSNAANPSSFKLSPTFLIVRKPELTLSADEVNFGLVPVGSPTEKTITIVNTGRALLDVSNMSILGNTEAEIVSGAPLSLNPAQSGELRVRITPQASGPISGQVRITHNATGSPTLLPLTGDAFVVVSVRPLPALSGLALHQNYPNPVSMGTRADARFTVDLPVPQSVTLTVYSMLGTAVRTVVVGVREAGRHEVDVPVGGLLPGAYLVRLATPTDVRTRVMHIVR